MRIAVLGCGPAGLLAAEAAQQFTDEIDIFSRKQKSEMPGAQFLHEPVTYLVDAQPKGFLMFKKIGMRDGYAAKVYGDPHAPVSWDSYKEGLYPAWSLGDLYDKLWLRWSARITDHKIGGREVRDHLCNRYDLVISTIPAPALCRGGRDHQFQGHHVWIVDREVPHVDDNTIIYNGGPIGRWYRTSKIFGHGSTEFPASAKAPCVGAHEGFKPTTTNCDCAPENVLKVGRFGKWDKKVLVHHVYGEVRNALLQMQ